MASRRASALRLIDEVETLSRFLFQLDQRNYNAIARRRRALESGNLQPDEAIAHFRPLREELIARSGFQGDIGSLRAELLATPQDVSVVCVPLWQLERDFPKLRQFFWVNTPVYALIAIRARGFYEHVGRPEVWMAESAMYEDMALAVNDLVNLGVVTEEDPIYRHKRRAWLVRSVIISAFFFVESYLNGIATEYLVTRRDQLSQKDRDSLAEYDSNSRTPRWVKFRDKLLKYPRIARGEPHPILDENNDVDVRAFLGEFRELRDAIVHASHRLEQIDGQLTLGKAGRLMQLLHNRDVAVGCADCAIRLVRKLGACVGRAPDTLRWLVDSDPATKLFPPRAFE